MPFTNNRIYVVAFLIIIVVIAAIAYAGSQTQTSRTQKGISVITINSEVGLKQIILTVLNSGATITLTQFDLPYSFNGTNGNTIQLAIFATSNYVFNTWGFNDGTFSSGDPYTHILTIKIEKPITITADLLYSPQPIVTPIIE